MSAKVEAGATGTRKQLRKKINEQKLRRMGTEEKEKNPGKGIFGVKNKIMENLFPFISSSSPLLPLCDSSDQRC